MNKVFNYIERIILNSYYNLLEMHSLLFWRCSLPFWPQRLFLVGPADRRPTNLPTLLLPNTLNPLILFTRLRSIKFLNTKHLNIKRRNIRHRNTKLPNTRPQPTRNQHMAMITLSHRTIT